MIPVKICGLSTPETVAAALTGGASFIGFVFFSASPRRIDPDAAARLAAPARGRASIVAVTADADDALLDHIGAVLAPDFIQLHGHESPARVRAAGARAGARTIKALAISEAADLATAPEFETVADHLMFDARAAPGAARPGGTGARFDWGLLSRAPRSRPWFLAGGLDPWNLAEAIETSAAPMVDVSSGVERGAGLKDPELIRAFLEAAARL